MKCPNCGNRTDIDLDIHSEGYSSDESPVKECGKCGLVWRIKVEAGIPAIDVIVPPKTEK